MNEKPYIFKLKPVFKQRIWGGRAFAELFGKQLPEGENIGESWEIADLPEGKCTVANGPDAEKTIEQIVEKYSPQQILAADSYSGQFPLLVKFLDCKKVLSVQVHPDAETCKRTGKGNPKTECWYIVKAKPTSHIFKGLKPGVTREQFSQAIKDGTVAELLLKVPVKSGECHFLPAGTCHAIGSDLLIAEIQTPSDTTYRVFDWNRVDPKTGKGRQLHIEDSLESINFQQDAAKLPVTENGRLVSSEFFNVDKHTLAAGEKIDFADGKMRAIIVPKGSGRITSGQLPQVNFKIGDSLLIPACIEAAIEADESCDFLAITLS